MPRPAERTARVLLLLAWMALITYWSGTGNLPIDRPEIATLLFGFQHRVAHLFAFGLVALLARWAFDGTPRAALWAVLLTSVFGATDEWHQSFTPGRHAGIDDWAWDTACATVALYASMRLRTTRWHARLRLLAPLAIGAVFVLGIGLAVRPAVSRHPDLNRAALRNVTTRVAHTAVEWARSTREVARQVRSTVAG